MGEDELRFRVLEAELLSSKSSSQPRGNDEGSIRIHTTVYKSAAGSKRRAGRHDVSAHPIVQHPSPGPAA